MLSLKVEATMKGVSQILNQFNHSSGVLFLGIFVVIVITSGSLRGSVAVIG